MATGTPLVLATQRLRPSKAQRRHCFKNTTFRSTDTGFLNQEPTAGDRDLYRPGNLVGLLATRPQWRQGRRPVTWSTVRLWRDGARNVLRRSLAKLGRHAEGEDERHGSVMCAAPTASTRTPGVRNGCDFWASICGVSAEESFFYHFSFIFFVFTLGVQIIYSLK